MRVISVREPPLLPGSLLVLAYAVVTQSAVVVPIAVWLHSPERAEVPLTAIYTWMQRNGHTIAAVATLTIGVFIVGYSVRPALIGLRSRRPRCRSPGRSRA